MRNNRPKELTYRIVNDTGFIVESACRLPELKCYAENGSILFWASILEDSDGNEVEAMQYLTPEVAMKMANSLRIMALEAFEQANSTPSLIK